MSEHSKDTSKQLSRVIAPELTDGPDIAEIDCSGLTRTVELLAAGHLNGESVVALLKHELATLRRQAESVSDALQRASIELRQLRESAQREQIQKQDEQRQLQDQNDRFVANLIQEHDQEKATLRRERDAAIDRIRELSRDMTRVSSNSSVSLHRAASNLTIRSAPPPQEVAELQCRVDELLHERERSLRLLRQLAEQRDLAENRLQHLLGSIGAQASGQFGARPETAPRRPSTSDAPLPPPPPPPPPAFAEPTVPTLGSPAASALVRTSLPALKESAPALGAALETPDAWDVDAQSSGDPSAPAHESVEASGHVSEIAVADHEARPSGPNATDSEETAAMAGQAVVARPGNPSLARLTKALDGSGAYSMHGSELSREEVFISRGPKNGPKRT